jgi:hypothetical protein
VLEVQPGVLIQVGGMQQGLGGNAADVQAGATQGPTGLNTRGLLQTYKRNNSNTRDSSIHDDASSSSSSSSHRQQQGQQNKATPDLQTQLTSLDGSDVATRATTNLDNHNQPMTQQHGNNNQP